MNISIIGVGIAGKIKSCPEVAAAAASGAIDGSLGAYYQGLGAAFGLPAGVQKNTAPQTDPKATPKPGDWKNEL